MEEMQKAKNGDSPVQMLEKEVFPVTCIIFMSNIAGSDKKQRLYLAKMPRITQDPLFGGDNLFAH